MHRTVAAALVAALALGVASCGGSEKTLTRAELVKQVELACREGQREGQKEVRRTAGRDGFIQGILTSQKTVLDRAEDITTSSAAAKADFEDFKAAMKQRIEAIERIAAASRADQQRVIRSMQAQMDAAGRKGQAAARRLGIRGCI